MPQSARQQAMIRQYEEILNQLRTSVNRAILSDGDLPPLAWWHDEATRELMLQAQQLRKQLPADYKPSVPPPTGSNGP